MRRRHARRSASPSAIAVAALPSSRQFSNLRPPNRVLLRPFVRSCRRLPCPEERAARLARFAVVLRGGASREERRVRAVATSPSAILARANLPLPSKPALLREAARSPRPPRFASRIRRVDDPAGGAPKRNAPAAAVAHHRRLYRGVRP